MLLGILQLVHLKWHVGAYIGNYIYFGTIVNQVPYCTQLTLW